MQKKEEVRTEVDLDVAYTGDSKTLAAPDNSDLSTLDRLIPKDYTVQDIFGFPSQIKLSGYRPGHPMVPAKSCDYVWNPGMAKDFIEWLLEDDPDPLWLTGPTGCGKTEAPKSVFHALNIPTVIVSAKSSTEPDDILGRTQLRDGNTIFVPGELLRAYEKGYAIIFDEIDGYNPEVIMACHRLLERETVVLDDGTVIRPAKKNYIVATANTRGDGQGGDLYAATNNFNLASLNRFEKWEMDYPAADVEIAILTNSFGGSLDPELIKAMVKTAADIRTAFKQGNCPGPISIRDMLRWGRKLKQSWHRKDVSPIYHAFDKSFGNGVDVYVREMLHTLVQTNFGVQIPVKP
jgi:cobaltochelatase CobS